MSKQLDKYFEERYKQFWAQEREKQKVLVVLPGVTPHEIRKEFDMEVAKALDVELTEEELLQAYKAIVEDMIITRGLRKD